MSTTASIRKIKIPSLNSSALPRTTVKSSSISEQTASSVDVLTDVANLLVRKFKILPKWNHSRSGLFEEFKTKSENKCIVELYRLCKKSIRKKSCDVPKESEQKPTKTLFRELKKKRNSSKKQRVENKKKQQQEKKNNNDADENTITESAQRSV
jgi:hypothetical protein